MIPTLKYIPSTVTSPLRPPHPQQVTLLHSGFLETLKKSRFYCRQIPYDFYRAAENRGDDSADKGFGVQNPCESQASRLWPLQSRDLGDRQVMPQAKLPSCANQNWWALGLRTLPQEIK